MTASAQQLTVTIILGTAVLQRDNVVNFTTSNDNAATSALKSVPLSDPVVTLKACRTAKALIWTAIIHPTSTLGNRSANWLIGCTVRTAPLHAHRLPLRVLIAFAHC
ncbi:protein of unknown function [Caballeronia sp. S22]